MFRSRPKHKAASQWIEDIKNKEIDLAYSFLDISFPLQINQRAQVATKKEDVISIKILREALKEAIKIRSFFLVDQILMIHAVDLHKKTKKWLALAQKYHMTEMIEAHLQNIKLSSLHIAILDGNLEAVRHLLSNSRISAEEKAYCYKVAISFHSSDQSIQEKFDEMATLIDSTLEMNQSVSTVGSSNSPFEQNLLQRQSQVSSSGRQLFTHSYQPDDIKRRLFACIEQNNVADFQQLLQCYGGHPNIVNSRDEHDRTLLMAAAENGNESFIAELLALSNIDVNETNKEEQTALLIAMRTGALDNAARIINDPRVYCHFTDKEGHDAAWYASRLGADGIIQQIAARFFTNLSS